MDEPKANPKSMVIPRGESCEMDEFNSASPLGKGKPTDQTGCVNDCVRGFVLFPIRENRTRTPRQDTRPPDLGALVIGAIWGKKKKMRDSGMIKSISSSHVELSCSPRGKKDVLTIPMEKFLEEYRSLGVIVPSPREQGFLR